MPLILNVQDRSGIGEEWAEMKYQPLSAHETVVNTQ